MAIADDYSQSDASRLAQFMGLPHWKTIDDLQLVERIRKGLPARSVETVARRIDPAGRFVRTSDIIPKSTLHRRAKENKPLSRDESERLLSLSRVFAEVLRLYHGDTARAASFLERPHPMLGRRSPYELAVDSIAGADLVLKLLTRADAGVAV